MEALSRQGDSLESSTSILIIIIAVCFAVYLVLTCQDFFFPRLVLLVCPLAVDPLINADCLTQSWSESILFYSICEWNILQIKFSCVSQPSCPCSTVDCLLRVDKWAVFISWVHFILFDLFINLYLVCYTVQHHGELHSPLQTHSEMFALLVFFFFISSSN